VQAGLAHAGRGYLDPHLTGTRRCEFGLGHLDRFVRL